jgi:hypothetical protein
MIYESDINFARNGFTDVQATLDTYAAKMFDGEFTCGWYGTIVNDERGAFCVVNPDSDLADEVGNYLRIKHSYSGTLDAISVYCVESHSIPYDLALSRRAFLALAPLWTPYLNVRVGQVLDGYDGGS